MFAVINRSEMVEAQQLRQSASVDLVVLVAFSHRVVASRSPDREGLDIAWTPQRPNNGKALCAVGPFKTGTTRTGFAESLGARHTGSG